MTPTEVTLVRRAAKLLKAYMQQDREGQQEWMKPYLDGTLDTALKHMREAAKRDRKATALLCK